MSREMLTEEQRSLGNRVGEFVHKVCMLEPALDKENRAIGVFSPLAWESNFPILSKTYPISGLTEIGAIIFRRNYRDRDSWEIALLPLNDCSLEQILLTFNTRSRESTVKAEVNSWVLGGPDIDVIPLENEDLRLKALKEVWEVVGKLRRREPISF